MAESRLAARRRLMRRPRVDAWSLPYGVYLEGETAVLFDRRYRPIVRFLPGEVVVPVDPSERIKFIGQIWHYRDATSARYKPATRAKLWRLVDAIPELRAEILRRN